MPVDYEKRNTGDPELSGFFNIVVNFISEFITAQHSARSFSINARFLRQ